MYYGNYVLTSVCSVHKTDMCICPQYQEWTFAQVTTENILAKSGEEKRVSKNEGYIHEIIS